MLFEIKGIRGSRHFIDPKQVSAISIQDDGNAFIRAGGDSFQCDTEEAEKMLAHINGAAAPSPAADVPAGAKLREINLVECYTSASGNKTWKAYDGDTIVYLRQAHVELLKEAGVWDALDSMEIGDTWDADILLYTVQDGDFHKPVAIASFLLYAPSIASYEVPASADEVAADDEDDETSNMPYDSTAHYREMNNYQDPPTDSERAQIEAAEIMQYWSDDDWNPGMTNPDEIDDDAEE